MPIGGMMTSSTSEVTILPKAAPMITPIARSRTLPRTANSLNSLNITPSSLVQESLKDFRRSWLGQHEEAPRPLGAQDLRLVVAVEHGRLPDEQVRIARRELLPSLPFGAA